MLFFCSAESEYVLMVWFKFFRLTLFDLIFFTLLCPGGGQMTGVWRIKNVYISTSRANAKRQKPVDRNCNYCWCTWGTRWKYLHGYYKSNDTLINKDIQRMYNIMTTNTENLFLNILDMSNVSVKITSMYDPCKHLMMLQLVFLKGSDQNTT